MSPTTTIEFVGTLFNSDNMTIGITSVRKCEILAELNKWRFKPTSTRKELESLIGKLQFIGNCVRASRVFIARLLNELRGMERGTVYDISDQARKDIQWWYDFVPKFDSTCIMWLLEYNTVDQVMAVDACLSGAGGVAGKEYYRLTFPKRLRKRNYNIVHLEMWAVIIAVRLWGDNITGKIITIRSDNEAVATIINSGRSFDHKLQGLLRELTWWLAHYNARVRSVHIAGKLNRLPDLLSRWKENPAVRQQFVDDTEGENMSRRHVNFDWFDCVHTW